MNAKTSNKPMPLGRGLSALFGDSDTAYQPRTSQNTAQATSARGEGGVRQVPIEWIQPGAFQPRRRFDDAAIQELASSIRERGILQPLMVRPIEGEKDSFEIIAGERRWRAAQIAGLHEIPVMVRHFTDRETMEIGLIENVQREDLSPIEEAEGYRRLVDEFTHSIGELSKIVGKSAPHISNLMRLLSLPQSVKDMVNAGELSMGHARAVVTAKDPEMLAREILKKGMSVRQAEALARKAESEIGGGNSKTSKHSVRCDPDILALESRLAHTLGLKTKLHAKGQKGHVTFFYESLDQLDGLLKRVES